MADYYISYNAVIKNSTIISSELECSVSLTSKKNNIKKYLFKIPVNFNENNVLKICKKYKENITDNLLKYSSVLYSQYIKDNDRIKIIFLPKRFDIIIKNGYAYFYLKGDE